jgi:predicted DNA binding CopG/RHH family protein
MPKLSPKIVPALTSDAEAEAFLAQDLSTLDFTQFKPLRLDQPKPPKRPTKP